MPSGGSGQGRAGGGISYTWSGRKRQGETRNQDSERSSRSLELISEIGSPNIPGFKKRDGEFTVECDGGGGGETSFHHDGLGDPPHALQVDLKNREDLGKPLRGFRWSKGSSSRSVLVGTLLRPGALKRWWSPIPIIHTQLKWGDNSTYLDIDRLLNSALGEGEALKSSFGVLGRSLRRWKRSHPRWHHGEEQAGEDFQVLLTSCSSFLCSLLLLSSMAPSEILPTRRPSFFGTW